jgi:hypothetical protein
VTITLFDHDKMVVGPNKAVVIRNTRAARAEIPAEVREFQKHIAQAKRERADPTESGTIVDKINDKLRLIEETDDDQRLHFELAGLYRELGRVCGKALQAKREKRERELPACTVAPPYLTKEFSPYRRKFDRYQETFMFQARQHYLAAAGVIELPHWSGAKVDAALASKAKDRAKEMVVRKETTDALVAPVLLTEPPKRQRF